MGTYTEFYFKSKLRKDTPIQDSKGIFTSPVKRYYFGKVKFGTPYFYPQKWNSTIIKISKTVPKYNGNKVYKLFGYFIRIGKPVVWRKNELGWKDKFETPRFEWSPAFYLFFFKWQFCIWWCAPDGDNDHYYEMLLWWRYYYKRYGSEKPNIKKAEEKWPWQDTKTKISTWNKNYIIFEEKIH